MSRAEHTDTGHTDTGHTDTGHTDTRRADTGRAVQDPGAGAEPLRDAPTAARAAGPVQTGDRGASRALWTLGIFRSELLTTLRRWRTLALLGVLAAVPVLIGIAVWVETGGGGGSVESQGGGGPAFITQITNNGLFLVFAALAATLPVFLPMAVGVVAGDAIAGEASAGTLRYLLVAPAGRTRLLLAKYASVLVFCLIATLVVAASALAVGALLFPLGEVTTISGTTISFGEGLLRAVLVAGVVAASLAGIAAIGLFVSTLAGSGIAAMATTVGLLITVQILDTIPQLDAVHPYLFPHHWMSFSDLMREPLYWDEVQQNLGLQALYVGVFGSAAWARFTTKDVNS
ncbi:ABC transporter permease [Streptomyces sp. NPDC005963]|uniref:ABC transporter permease n=1 Tax=Streptomyces sp. NPDC005963 TaxID=3156721 RepID=UPI0033D32B1E